MHALPSTSCFAGAAADKNPAGVLSMELLRWTYFENAPGEILKSLNPERRTCLRARC